MLAPETERSGRQVVTVRSVPSVDENWLSPRNQVSKAKQPSNLRVETGEPDRKAAQAGKEMRAVSKCALPFRLPKSDQGSRGPNGQDGSHVSEAIAFDTHRVRQELLRLGQRLTPRRQKRNRSRLASDGCRPGGSPRLQRTRRRVGRSSSWLQRSRTSTGLPNPAVEAVLLVVRTSAQVDTFTDFDATEIKVVMHRWHASRERNANTAPILGGRMAVRRRKTSVAVPHRGRYRVAGLLRRVLAA